MHPFCCYPSSENINCHSIQAARKKFANNIKRALEFYYYSQFYMAKFQTATHGVHATLNAYLSFVNLTIKNIFICKIYVFTLILYVIFILFLISMM